MDIDQEENLDDNQSGILPMVPMAPHPMNNIGTRGRSNIPRVPVRPSIARKRSVIGNDVKKKRGYECSICLDVKKGKQVGRPSCCNHEFCLKCLKGWAKKSSECPIDRKKFDFIKVVDVDSGKVIKEINRNSKQIFRGNEPIESRLCFICKHMIPGKQIARPDTCQHNFCVACLKRHGRVNGQCPVDGTGFTLIRIIDAISGTVDKVINRLTGRAPKNVGPKLRFHHPPIGHHYRHAGPKLRF